MADDASNELMMGILRELQTSVNDVKRGQQMLVDRMDRMETAGGERFDTLESMLSGFAGHSASLTASTCVSKNASTRWSSE